MGVDHGGRRDTAPRIWTIMQIAPPVRFCNISTKRSVLWPLKYAKIRFRPELPPGPCWGELTTIPRPPSRPKRGHSSSYLPQSAPTHLRPSPCVPQNYSQIYILHLCRRDPKMYLFAGHRSVSALEVFR